MDEKRNEPGENPRKKSFRTLALVAQSLQPSAQEKQYSARFVNITILLRECVSNTFESTETT